MAESVMITGCCGVKPRNLVRGYTGQTLLSPSPEHKLRQQLPPESWHASTKLLSFTYKKTVILRQIASILKYTHFIIRTHVI